MPVVAEDSRSPRNLHKYQLVSDWEQREWEGMNHDDLEYYHESMPPDRGLGTCSFEVDRGRCHAHFGRCKGVRGDETPWRIRRVFTGTDAKHSCSRAPLTTTHGEHHSGHHPHPQHWEIHTHMIHEATIRTWSAKKLGGTYGNALSSVSSQVSKARAMGIIFCTVSSSFASRLSTLVAYLNFQMRTEGSVWKLE